MDNAEKWSFLASWRALLPGALNQSGFKISDFMLKKKSLLKADILGQVNSVCYCLYPTFLIPKQILNVAYKAP